MKNFIFIFLIANYFCSGQVINNCTTTDFLTKRDANGNLVCSTISEILSNDGSVSNRIYLGNPDVNNQFINNNGTHVANKLSVYGNTYLVGNAFFFKPQGSTSNQFMWFFNPDKGPEGIGQGWKIGNTDVAGGYGASNGFSIMEGFNGLNSDTKLFIQDGTGKVGIGTTNLSCASCDDYLLFVKKGIKTERVKVEIATTAGWADYVFKKDYKLPTLQDVEKQIQEKGHLADIPSAQQVVENGVELGEMSKLLLQKIEELTLYIIEQNKTNEKQAKEIEALKTLVNTRLQKNK